MPAFTPRLRLPSHDRSIGVALATFAEPLQYPPWLLNQAAFCLRAAVRLFEALVPMRAAVESRVEFQDWRQAAISLVNMSELSVLLGDIVTATEDATHAMSCADRNGDDRQTSARPTTSAWIT